MKEKTTVQETVKGRNMIDSDEGINRYATHTPPPDNDYKTAKMPYPNKGQAELYNLQVCMCGHDRMVHTNYIGHGKKREIILDCDYAGHCSCSNCECEKFVFSGAQSSLEGKDRRKKEVATKKVHPTQAKVKAK